MDLEIKNAIEALERSVHDFRAANDERVAQLASKGEVDALVDEKVDRINAAVTACQDKLEELRADAATRERVDELELALNRKGLGGKGEDQRDLRVDARVFFAGKDGRPETRVTDEEVENYGAYAKAFPQFLKGGVSPHQPDVMNAMTVGSDPDGGYWVPTEQAARILVRLFETSPMRQLTNALPITTDSIAFPTDTNDATSGGWVGETESRSDTATPKVGEQTIYVREQYAQPKVSQKLLDMATIDVEAWLNGKIGDKMSRTENTAFVSGTGVSQPRGFLDYKSAAVTTDDDSRAWGVLQYVVSGASGAFPSISGLSADDANALLTLISKLKPEYRPGAVFAMNRSVEAAVRKLRDNEGRYLVGMGDIRDGARGFELFGFPIATMEDMPDLGSDTFSVAFGNFGAGYQIVDGRGLRILRDPYTDKPYVKFYTTKWTGGDVVNFDAIKLMKFGTS